MDGLTRGSSSSSSSGCGGGAGCGGGSGQQEQQQQAAEPQVFVLAASNLPWDLDQALLR
jgi:SpoVK/Ycf46/Vps4 family AAA+-type ATPase